MISIQKVISKPLRYGSAKLKHAIRKQPKVAAPVGTDWVGYEGLIEFIKSSNILSVEGDLVEIGTFLGGGAYKLSKFLEYKQSQKKLYVIDVFDPTFDWTMNTSGDRMETLYQNALKRYEGKSQWDVFSEVTKDCSNIIVLKDDSKKVNVPSERFCFAFIDGNHAPEYVESDFYLVWNRLSPNGAVVFHDYKWDLPQTTAKIDELLSRHSSEIKETCLDMYRHALFVIKKN